jgi:hypothetical protein
MSDTNKPNSGSFAQAFLPGLILGLVIGAVAGALLPDLLGGSKIPAPTGEYTPGTSPDADRDGMPDMPTQDEAEQMIDDAAGTIEDPAVPDPAGNP